MITPLDHPVPSSASRPCVTSSSAAECSEVTAVFIEPVRIVLFSQVGGVRPSRGLRRRTPSTALAIAGERIESLARIAACVVTGFGTTRHHLVTLRSAIDASGPHADMSPRGSCGIEIRDRAITNDAERRFVRVDLIVGRRATSASSGHSPRLSSSGGDLFVGGPPGPSGVDAAECGPDLRSMQEQNDHNRKLRRMMAYECRVDSESRAHVTPPPDGLGSSACSGGGESRDLGSTMTRRHARSDSPGGDRIHRVRRLPDGRSSGSDAWNTRTQVAC
jgi:hypothetical protein